MTGVPSKTDSVAAEEKAPHVLALAGESEPLPNDGDVDLVGVVRQPTRKNVSASQAKDDAREEYDDDDYPHLRSLHSTRSGLQFVQV